MVRGTDPKQLSAMAARPKASPCTKSGSYRHVHIYMREEKDSASYECARDARRFLPEAAALFEDGADRFFFEEETLS